MSESVKYAIEIVDKWGKPLQRFRSDIGSLNRVRAKDPFRDMPKSLGQLHGQLSRYKKLQSDAFRSDHVRKYGNLIAATENKIRRLEQTTVSCKKKTTSFASKLFSAPGLIFGGGVLMGLRKIGTTYKDLIDKAAEFEKYQVTLKTMLGSQGAARERMTEYADIAAKTPFQLNQVVEAGNQLQAIGRYSRDNLTQLGDLAAASGKPIEQVMNAYAKLSTGQKGEAVNMFRDLLISSEDWANATGKGIKKNGELAATTEEMLGALPKILKKKGFFGMMDQQAKTTEGRLSNLGDSFDMLKVAVGDNMKPSFDSFISGTTKIVENMRAWVEVPTAEKIGREKAQLNALVGVITDANTGEEVRADLMKELRQQYPEFLDGLDQENIKNQQLIDKLKEVNRQYENKMRLASMKDKVSNIEQDYQEALQEVTDAKMAIEARDKMEELRGGVISIKNRLYDKGDYGYVAGSVKNSALAATIRSEVKSYYANTDDHSIYSADDIQKFNEWLSNYETFDQYDSVFSSPEKALAKTKAELAQKKNLLTRYKQKQAETEKAMTDEDRKLLLEKAKGIDIGDTATFEKLFGKKDQKEAKSLASEFDQMRQKPFEAIEKWSRLSDFVEGKLKYRSGADPEGSPSNGTNPPVTNSLEKASATITGGGRMVKQVHVTIENLIGENTNMFREGETITDAHDFMDKLTNAMKLAVNDVNNG